MIAVLRFLFLIPLGFVLACLAASFAMLWPFVALPSDMTDPFVWMELSVGFLAQGAQIGSLAFIPWALFMIVTEAMGWRSLLPHAGAGILAGFVATRALPGIDTRSLQTAMVVAGLSFSLVYWLIAGSSAGSWRRRRTDTPPSDH
ncbi:hypothetical protein [Aureimonas sp. ME7]|uniref:hypothetical protein n=1 Tax=Aureimonas sp. ME7 TaxID=2744252 RepID=UPI0015F6FF4E|nr:hypothetical protein [Aureimonas sp. ME7]